MTPPIDEKIRNLTAERDRLRIVNAKLVKACIQLRGALKLDHMIDDKGEPFGTTQVALEVSEAAIAAAEE